MISRMEECLDRKKSELNVEKKIMRCRKGEKKEIKIDWRWKGKKLQEVKVYKYLEYIVQRNRGQQTQMRREKKGSYSNERSVGDRKEATGKRLEQKDIVFRYTGMDSYEIWNRDMDERKKRRWRRCKKDL